MFLTSSWKTDLILLIILIVFLIYKYLTRNFDYWKKRGVYSFKPIPIFGNFYEALTFKKNFAETLQTFYDKTDEPYFGIYIFDAPVLVLKSPEVIKTVLVRDFTYFNSRSFASADHNPLYANFLLFQKYGKWKDTRAKIRPIFSVSKLKDLFLSVEEVTKQFKDYLKNNPGPNSSRNFSQRYSSEIVARCFFGVDGNCFDIEESQFLKTSRNVFKTTKKDAFVQGLYLLKPTLVHLFKLNFLRKQEEDFLVKVFKDCMDTRKGYNEKVRDYIDIVMKDKHNSENYSEKDLMAALANAIESFVAGTDTLGAALYFTFYHLALDPRIQLKIRKECTEILEKHGSFTYESLQDMKYIDMCINESSRMYVSLNFINRKCVKDYLLEETGLVIEKDTVIFIPFHSLHLDKMYFPEPKKFKPERFLDETINEKGLFYFPFGGGPRMCVASQFAKLVLRYVLAQVVSTFEIKPCENTPPVEEVHFEPMSFTLHSAIDLPIRFELIKKSEK